MSEKKPTRDEIRAMMNDLASTPYTRAKDRVAYFLAKVAIVVGLIWLLTQCDSQAAMDWWNGK